MMRIEAGFLGSIILQGTAEDWHHVSAGLEALYREMTQEVLPAVAEDVSPNGITVTTREALTIMAIMEDDALAHALAGLAVSPGSEGTAAIQTGSLFRQRDAGATVKLA
jgi:hypothetical protein